MCRILGKITISYTSYDSKNKAGKTSEYEIYNYKNLPESFFDYDGLENNYESVSKAEGDILKIYPCSVISPLYFGDDAKFANVSLYKDGNVLEGFDSKVIDTIIMQLHFYFNITGYFTFL